MKKVFILFVFCFLLIYPFFVLAEDRVEINTASLEQLDKITSVGPVIAQRIVDARPFYSIDDLLKVKGIGEKTLQKIKDQGLAYVGGQTQVTQTPPETSPAQASVEQPTTVTYQSGIFINEILPSPQGADETNEFIELYNLNNFDIDLDNWKIQDTEGTTTTYVFSQGIKISAKGYLVFKRSETKVLLNNDKDGLNLMWPNDKIVDSVFYENAPRNQSYNKNEGTWKWSASITPGNLNIITTYNPQKTSTNLSKQKKSDSNIATASIQNAINPTENYNMVNDTENKTYNETPWFMLLISIIVIIVSGGIILLIKFKNRPTD